ncbi:threonine aldolase [Ornatilinea apprima]|uniref:Threonine aldolase n=1 Tax=Ornatilinea apprima TaxID=1134406 RepID=A0A0P6XXX6_9CHLR|nr:low-specificity L-threonine aldolase [Ornatilinea apprima]KPL78237.1 threonine aldolase [Ornatilinea apprima]
MQWIDLRSDTVTQPTAEMRAVMVEAVVGDDVYGEDPTVQRLQAMSAERLGKEAGLFVPSGTMGNLIGVLAHCGRGDEVIMGSLAHTFLFEAGGVAALGGVHPHTLPNLPDGTIALEDIRLAVRDANNPHYPTSRLIVLENTHNRCGGVAVPVEFMLAVKEIADANGLKMHLDGARIFNAETELGVAAAELAQPFDSVTFCLSKGLCAPVGSVLCGSKPFIQQALRLRKMLGGGMRQAGILAAAGIIALEKMTLRLGEDHRRAAELGDLLASVDGLRVEKKAHATNMVFVNLDESIQGSAGEIAGRLKSLGVLASPTGARQFRLVLHYWISDADVKATAQAFRQALSV